MNIFENITYKEGLKIVSSKLACKTGTFLITGATGLIGSCMIDVLLYSNNKYGSSFRIYALGRNKNRLEARFGYREDLEFIEQDITEPLNTKIEYDYIIHAASNADPKSYAQRPVETVLTNVIGAKNVLDYCKSSKKTRVMLTSTFEVYGKHNSDEYAEHDFGELDQNSIRSGYPESKRTAEILFRSYNAEYGVDAIIARLSSIYGPTMLKNDSKAHAQFIRNGLAGEDIVLKSKGLQKRTYCYIFDAVSGLFKVLFDGTAGEVYNIANKNSVATIAEVAQIVSNICGTQVVYNIPDDNEAKGFSKPQNCILVTKKLEELGWVGKFDLRKGLEDTIKILQEMQE